MGINKETKILLDTIKARKRKLLAIAIVHGPWGYQDFLILNNEIEDLIYKEIMSDNIVKKDIACF